MSFTSLLKTLISIVVNYKKIKYMERHKLMGSNKLQPQPTPSCNSPPSFKRSPLKGGTSHRYIDMSGCSLRRSTSCVCVSQKRESAHSPLRSLWSPSHQVDLYPKNWAQTEEGGETNTMFCIKCSSVNPQPGAKGHAEHFLIHIENTLMWLP